VMEGVASDGRSAGRRARLGVAGPTSSRVTWLH
jgi:hypothetical protein